MPTPAVKPSIVRIIQSDYIATLALLFPLVFLGMYVVIAVFGFIPGLGGRDPIMADGSPFFFWGTIIAALIGLPLAYWRVKIVRDVFKRGVEVPGVVLDVKFFRDRGSVSYQYPYDGQTLLGFNAIAKTKRTAALRKDAPVVLIVDKENPAKAFVRDLYV
jgi:hypothetical protein